MARVNSSHDILNPGLEITNKNHSNKYKKQLQKIGEGSRDGNAKEYMYSNKGSRDDNKILYNRHPYITHMHTGITQHSLVPCGATCTVSAYMYV